MSVFYRFRFFFLLVGLTFSALHVPHVYAQSGEIIMPDAGELNTIDEEGEILDDTSTSIAAPSAVSDEVSDNFFDAEDLVPQGEMAKKGPVKVDPAMQPASKLIIVKKNYEGDSKTAQLVSAERALALGRYDAAIEMFDSLYDVNKSDSRVVMGRAVALQRLQRFDEAMQMYEQLEKLEPKNIEVKVNMLGLLSTRYPSIALRRLIELYKENKTNIGVVSQLAVVYAKVGDSASALRYMEVAASMEPQNANHIYNMAVIADRSGDTSNAVKYYEQALETDTIYGGGRSIPRDAVYERLAQIR